MPLSEQTTSAAAVTLKFVRFVILRTEATIDAAGLLSTVQREERRFCAAFRIMSILVLKHGGIYGSFVWLGLVFVHILNKEIIIIDLFLLFPL